ncbi:PE family protein PE3 [Mycobacterium simulans]|uniref:PE family protein PE3 n=1 Tax=Mycobacterium simulans TaxID=627089 RepID=A0A7Z7N7N1_9MYCO|nr:PE family protein [Mycobacterium simulans]SOJ52767.1 PE family protein PE3 [Mycobacterium simulans]
MSYLAVQPDFIATAAADLSEIRAAIAAASAVATAPTTGLVAAAADEVSEACANLFNTYANEYQAFIRQVSEFHDDFVRTVAAAGIAYAETEIANAGGTAASVAAAAAPLATAISDPATTYTIVMGASGYPIPAVDYIDDLAALYIFPWRTIGANLRGLNTPEGLYPLTGIKDLTLNDSVARGLTILDRPGRLILHPSR